MKILMRTHGQPLRKGWIIQHENQPFEVIRTSDSNAAIRPFSRRAVEIRPRFAEAGAKPVTFTAPRATVYISECSHVAVLALTRAEYEKHLGT